MALDKNIGQVSVLSIGNEPPTNLNLIWYDSQENIHKVYDYSIEAWIQISQNVISPSSIGELANIAANPGLSLGRFFLLMDVDETIALSVNKTTIQYFDLEKNLVIFDLLGDKKYFISSNNLLIDGFNGEWDEGSNNLNFNYADGEIDLINTHFLTRSKVAGVWKPVKVQINKLRSNSNKNSIIFTNKGLYFSLTDSISKILNTSGGIVGYNTYLQQITSLTNQIQNIILAVTDALIMGKKITSLQTISQPSDIANGDTILTAFSKIQKYINIFKKANYSVISENFNDTAEGTYIIAGNTVEKAFEKVQFLIKNLLIKSPYSPSVITNGKPVAVAVNDTFQQAISKIEGHFKTIQEFDFVVDSEASMAVAFSGNPYKRIYVKFNKDQQDGNYEVDYTLMVNHNTSKYIYFEPGVKIVSIVRVGIAGNADYQNSDDQSQLFLKNCSSKLVNCHLIMRPFAVDIDLGAPIIGFWWISFMENCVCEMDIDINIDNSTFEYITNSNEHICISYFSCSNLRNCVSSYVNLTIDIIGSESSYGSSVMNKIFREFSNCWNLMNCFCYGMKKVNMEGISPYEVDDCIFSENCTTIIGGRYHGLIDCKKVLQTYYKYVHSISGNSYNCSINSISNQTNQIGDSANGGFNSMW